MRRVLVAAERLVPSPSNVEDALRALSPDAVVVTPLIARGPSGLRQTDTVKAARALHIPVGFAVASWDHLTTKGIVKVVPDRVFVWNETQRREAVEIHGLPSDRIVVTGAQLFDSWFDQVPTAERAAFLEALGLDPAAPMVLFVGSSPNIATPTQEITFVCRWLKALRASSDPNLSGVGVLVRPHPGNIQSWAAVDLSPLGAAIAPRERPGIPMGFDDDALYFHSIHHAAAVVGVNTSAMIESLVQRRPVLTIRAPEFHATQQATLHFQYLLPAAGGPLQAADGFSDHQVQLADALAHPERFRDQIDAFVLSFLRPRGLDIPATPIIVDSLEDMMRQRR